MMNMEREKRKKGDVLGDATNLTERQDSVSLGKNYHVMQLVGDHQIK